MAVTTSALTWGVGSLRLRDSAVNSGLRCDQGCWLLPDVIRRGVLGLEGWTNLELPALRSILKPTTNRTADETQSFSPDKSMVLPYDPGLIRQARTRPARNQPTRASVAAARLKLAGNPYQFQ